MQDTVRVERIKLVKNRKGISTFIATLLLMVLAVSAGVVIYAYTMGYLGGFGGTEQLGAMSADEVYANSSMIRAYVRNIGKTTLNVSRVYVDGDLMTICNATTGTIGNSVEILENEVAAVYIGADDPEDFSDDDFQSGKTYEVKLIAADNTQLSLSVKAD
jgi:hypothetical protein